MAIPTVHALRHAFPQAHLAVEAQKGQDGLFHWVEGVDQVLACPKGRGFAQLGERNTHATKLRKLHFDVGVLLPNSLSTAFWLWRCGCKRRIGTAVKGRSLLLTDPVPLTTTMREAHQAEWYLALLKPLGIEATLSTPALRVPEGIREAMARETGHPLPAGTPYAILAPGSAYGPAKDWIGSHFAEVARRLHQERDLHVLISGAPADREAAERIAHAAGDGVINIAGQTSMDTFLYLLSQASAYVGNDSGASHCAAAFGIPTVAIFGSTRPDRTRPLGDRVAYPTADVACAPCLARECRHGPNENDKACMQSITPDAVWAALEELEDL
jgi:heptosyltransferase-2